MARASILFLSLLALLFGQRTPRTVRDGGEVPAPGGEPSRLVSSPEVLCVESIEDQAGGPCLSASSVPVPGLLFPPPHDGGLNNSATGSHAFVGGGQSNTVSGDQATVGGGAFNFGTGNRSSVGGGQANVAFGPRAVVAGGDSNSASGEGSFVGGGKDNDARADMSKIGGGLLNAIDGYAGVIGGGRYNGISSFSDFSAIAGGYFNTASGAAASCGGGWYNQAGAASATVGGGFANSAAGSYATVPGGRQNRAAGPYGFAAGRRAKANHQGAFVWGDSVDADKTSSADDEFNVYASGGTRIFSNAAATSGVQLAPGSGTWSSLSDRETKENVCPVVPEEVLERLLELPIATWNYRSQDASVRHLGPMAQDFNQAFGLGVDSRHIDGVDPDGVALAAIQGLAARFESVLAERDARIAELERRLEALERR